MENSTLTSHLPIGIQVNKFTMSQFSLFASLFFACFNIEKNQNANEYFSCKLVAGDFSK